MFLNGGEKINQKSQQWETLISIKQIVFGLTEENVSKTVNLLCDEFDKDLSYSFNLLVSQMTFIMFIQRKIAIDTYLSFLNEIKTFEDNNKSKYKIYDVLTRFLLSKNTQESKCLLYYLYKYKIIDPNIIKPPHDPFFVHYMSEKEIKNLEYHDLFHQIEVNYEELSKNDWELHKRLIEEGINPSEITKIIHDDDVGKLQEISSQTNFDFDQEIEASLYERCSFINEGDVKLIDYAAFFGSVKCFKYLLMNGSNISNAGKYAVAGGNIEIIHLCEAEIQISSNEASIEFHQNEIFKYIYENIFKENNDLEELVKKCIEYHNYEILAILLKGEMKIDDDIINKTAEIGNIYLTKYFLDSNQIPKNILPFSSQSGNIELVKYIFEKYGIDVNAKGRFERTALMFASRYGHTELVQLLLEQEGIDINAKDEDGDTALMLASYEGYIEIVKLLLEQEGIDINAKDKWGWTALMHASYEGYTEIVKILLEQEGIDIHAQDYEEKTALTLACETHHDEIAEILREH